MNNKRKEANGKRQKAGWVWRVAKIVIIIYCVVGIALYFFQDRFLFQSVSLPPDYRYNFAYPFREVNIPVDGENLNIVQFLPKDPARGVVLYFHGNRININHYAAYAENFTKHGYDVWMPDYPGYGKTTGKISEEKLYREAMVVYKLAAEKFSKDSIILYGRSLGSGIAAQLASIADCRRLILETPYYSIPALFACYAPIYPTSLLSKFNIPAWKYLQSVKAPVTIFHGDADEIIPYHSAARLKNVLKPADEFITIAKGRHNNLNDFTLFHQKLDSLLR